MRLYGSVRGAISNGRPYRDKVVHSTHFGVCRDQSAFVGNFRSDLTSEQLHYLELIDRTFEQMKRQKASFHSENRAFGRRSGFCQKLANLFASASHEW